MQYLNSVTTTNLCDNDEICIYHALRIRTKFTELRAAIELMAAIDVFNSTSSQPLCHKSGEWLRAMACKYLPTVH